MKLFKQAFGLVLAVCLGGCSHLSYYAQAVGGHLQVMNSARAIPRLLDDPDVAPGLKGQLRQVAAIRQFATGELGLPDNGSYQSYADLGRPYVVWNVFAAKEFSADLEAWCLLFVGCVNYRGYYSRENAERFARKLRDQGLETHIGSVPAYSTLGYFPDPVLNTFLRFGEQEVARLVFHELAHQLVFIPGDSSFNESFATAVEIEGMRRWLDRNGTPEQHRNFETRQQRRTEFQNLIADCRQKLRDLYTQALPPDEKRQAKAAIITGLRKSYAELKTRWGESAGGYDTFFNQEINNATLGSVSLYTSQVPAFQNLLAQADYDLPRFYREAKALAKLSKADRLEALNALGPYPAANPIGSHEHGD